MLFKIIAVPPDHTEAFAEQIQSIRRDENGSVWYIDMYGHGFFTDRERIIKDPVIIRECALRYVYKIRLGEGE